jgi:hypothetical protein
METMYEGARSFRPAQTASHRAVQTPAQNFQLYEMDLLHYTRDLSSGRCST